MKKYAIKLTHGDTVKILGVCETKDEAMKLGTDMRKLYSRDDGLLACIEADFDAEGNMIGTGYKLNEIFL